VARARYSGALLVVSLIALVACSHDAPLECGSFTLVFPPITVTDETTGQLVCDATVQIVATDGGGEDGDAGAVEQTLMPTTAEDGGGCAYGGGQCAGVCEVRVSHAGYRTVTEQVSAAHVGCDQSPSVPATSFTIAPS